MSLTLENIKSLLTDQTDQIITNLKSEIKKDIDAKVKTINGSLSEHDNQLYNQFIESNCRKFTVRIREKNNSLNIENLKSKIFAASNLNDKTTLSVRKIKSTKSGQDRYACEVILSDDRFKIFKSRAALSKNSNIILEFPFGKIMDKANKAVQSKFNTTNISTSYTGYLLNPDDHKPIFEPFTL